MNDECPVCRAIRNYMEMRLCHLQVLRECTFCLDGSLVARKNELMEIEAVMDGKEIETPWTLRNRDSAHRYRGHR